MTSTGYFLSGKGGVYTLYILCFISIVCTGWYFHEHLFGEGSVRLKGEKLPEVKKDNSKVLIGKGVKGKVYHNFLTYPHLLVAGHTGYGKTNFIRTVLEQVEGDVFLIDMKYGDDYPRKQVKASNIDEASGLLESILNHMRVKRNHHIFVVVDEAYEFIPKKWLKKEEKSKYYACLNACSEIARIGRSFNVHLILATQYPTADVIDGQIKQNMEARIVFRLPEDHASEVALDSKGAEELPAGVKGRAIYKTDVKQIIQTYEMERVEGDNENGNQETEGESHSYRIG